MKSDLKHTIGKRVQEVRCQMGFTQAELAEMTDLSVSYISYIECGKKIMSVKTLIKIVDALNVTVNELLYGQQKADTSSYHIEMDLILSQCDEEQRRIIYLLAKVIMNSMQNYPHQ